MSARGVDIPVVFKSDTKGLSDAEGALGKIGGVLGNVGIAAGVAFAAAAAGAVAFGVGALKAAADADHITKNMENAAKNAGLFGSSAGEISKVTEALDKHSTKLAEMTGVDDEYINGLKTSWLAVPAIAGMGIDGINRLATISLDIAASAGKDAEGVATSIAKAFENPETALAKLQKAGVFLTDQQNEMYTQLVETGQAAEAQAYLVDTLGEKYKGAAEAAANPFDRLKVIFENLQETIGSAMLPAIEKLVPVIAEFVDKLTASPAFQQFIEVLATTFQQLTDALLPLLQPIMDLIMTLLPPLMEIIQALVPVVIAIVEAFVPFIEAILPPLIDLIDALLPIFMDLFKTVIEPLLPIIVKLVEAFIPLVVAILPVLMRVIDALVPVVIALLEAFMPILEKLLPPLVKLFGKLAEPLLEMLEKILPYLPPLIEALGLGLEWLVDNILTPLIDALSTAVDWFNKLLGMDGKKVNVTATASGQRTNYDGSTDHDGNPANRFARGGIIGGRIDNAIVGEAGPEAIIPLDQLNTMLHGSGSSGNTINIVVNAGMGADGAALGEQIVTAIRKYERSSGAVFARA